MSDSGEKTEKATPQHLKKVREEGGLQKSQDLTGWISLAAGAVLLPTVISSAANNGREQFTTLKYLVSDPSLGEILAFLGQSLMSVLWTLLPFMLAIMLVAVLVNIIQGKGVFPSAKHLKPKLQNLNVIKGIKKIVGVQPLWNGLKALIKTIAVGVVLYVIISGVMEIMGAAGHMSGYDIVNYGNGKMWFLIWASVIAGIVVSVLDALFIFKKKPETDQDVEAAGEGGIQAGRRRPPDQVPASVSRDGDEPQPDDGRHCRSRCCGREPDPLCGGAEIRARAGSAKGSFQGRGSLGFADSGSGAR